MKELREALRDMETALQLISAAQVLEGTELDEVHRLVAGAVANLRTAAQKLSVQ